MAAISIKDALTRFGLVEAQAALLSSEAEDRALETAPCLGDLSDNDIRVERAERTLVRAAMRWASQGWGGVRSQSVGGQYSVTWDSAPAGEFTGAEISRLRRICGGVSGSAHAPMGSFPPAGRYDYLFATPPAGGAPNRG